MRGTSEQICTGVSMQHLNVALLKYIRLSCVKGGTLGESFILNWDGNSLASCSLLCRFALFLPSYGDICSHFHPQIFDRMCQALGGRVAEEIVFGKVSTGT